MGKNWTILHRDIVKQSSSKTNHNISDGVGKGNKYPWVIAMRYRNDFLGKGVMSYPMLSASLSMVSPS